MLPQNSSAQVAADRAPRDHRLLCLPSRSAFCDLPKGASGPRAALKDGIPVAEDSVIPKEIGGLGSDDVGGPVDRRVWICKD